MAHYVPSLMLWTVVMTYTPYSKEFILFSQNEDPNDFLNLLRSTIQSLENHQECDADLVPIIPSVLYFRYKKVIYELKAKDSQPELIAQIKKAARDIDGIMNRILNLCDKSNT